MSTNQDICGHVFHGVICTLHKGHHACAAGMHFSAGPEHAPPWWERRWTKARPLIMMSQHWVRGFCTRCSAAFAAPTFTQFCRVYRDAQCFRSYPSPAHHRIKASRDVIRTAVIDYTNWKGERTLRRILPQVLRWGCNTWHPEAQWLLDAMDMDKEVPRTFAFATIHSWTDNGDDKPS